MVEGGKAGKGKADQERVEMERVEREEREKADQVRGSGGGRNVAERERVAAAGAGSWAVARAAGQA